MVDQLMGQMWKIVHLQLQLGDTLKFDLPLRSIKQNNAYPIFPWAVAIVDKTTPFEPAEAATKICDACKIADKSYKK
jgi:hypothetical protein